MRRILIASLALLCVAAPATAEDLNEILKRVNELVAEKKYTKALEELSWAKKEIEAMNSGALTELLPKEVKGFAGGEVEANNALGISNLARTYTRAADGASLRLSLMGGTAGGEGLGGLMQFGKMAAMMAPKQNAFRVKGRTAMVENNEITIFLDSGSMLKLEPVENVDMATLKSVAEALDVDAIDTYLKG